MWNMICFILCSIAAVCLGAVDYGDLGIIMIVCMLGINLGCYVEDINGQNKELKNELYAANKKLDNLEKLIKRLEK